MKRVVCVLLAVIVLTSVSVLSVSAIDYGCDVSTVSKAVYLENLDTGAVIMEKNADERMYPASTTKIMTYVVVADSISDFDGTKITIKEDVLKDLDPESTVMGLSTRVGQDYSVRDLLYGMMLPSGNDAALVLADYVGNGIPGFVDMMNKKAEELGCTGTNFVNPHGLHDDNHYSTARDLAKITKYARGLNSFMDITNTVSYTPARFDQPLTNTNYMINSGSQYTQYYYPNVRGVKTGFTDQAGKCLVTTAVKDDFSYLCVTLGADYSPEEDINYAMTDTASLYDWVFENMGIQTICTMNDVAKTVSVDNAKGDGKLNLTPAKDLTALLPKTYDKDLVEMKIECEESFSAPISRGQTLGKATVYYGDMMVGETDLVASKSIEQDSFKALTNNTGSWIKSHLLLVISIAAILLALIIALVAVSKANKKKRARERARRRYR